MLKRLCALLVCLALLLPVTTLGEAVPTLTALDFSAHLMDGTEFTLSEQTGKVVFLNFWATWCGPCRSEMPDINRLTALYAEDDEVLVLTISCGDAPEDVEDYLADNGFELNVICDVYGQLLDAYGFDGIPVTLIFDRTGALSTGWVGARTDLYDQVTTIIEGLR